MKGEGEAGGEWVIDGQKIWTSGAMHCTHVFTLVRTDPDAPKHRGLTFLLVPLGQPGIEVRPIRHMAGGREFCEIFFTDARTGAGEVVGKVNGGWAVSKTLLVYERGEEAATNPILFRAEFERLAELARRSGAIKDPVLRQRLAAAFARVEVMRYIGYRILTDVLDGKEMSAAASVSKLYWSEYHRQATQARPRHRGPGRADSHREGAEQGVPRRRPGQRPDVEQHLVAGLAERAGRHHLRRHVGGPAEHHRRAGSRPAAVERPSRRKRENGRRIFVTQLS